MEEMIDFALMRHGEMVEEIEKRKAEIERLMEHKENLEVFVATAKELGELATTRKWKEGPSPTSLEDQKEKSDQVSAKVMPVRDAKSA